MTLVLVALAGLAGVLVRYAVVSATEGEATLPWVILAVNVAGSFLLGALVALPWGPRSQAALGVGFLGGLTTFSTLSVQTLQELQAGRPGRALGLAVASVVLGVGAAAAGWALGRVLA